MEYRNLGKSGLKVSELSFGSWITFGRQLDMDGVRSCMREAVDAGVNFFDNAEAYEEGLAELIMGEILREYKREELVLATKIFWGGAKANLTGLSWKHLVEGTKNSLRRLQLEYVDILFCHRPDPSTPLEETVRAMDYLVKGGFTFYWGTSEWSAPDIEKAHQIARDNYLTPPQVEQPQYNLFHRERVEHEYLPLYQKYGMGVTSWSPLDFGILTGKYNQGIPDNSRLALNPDLQSHLSEEKLTIVKRLMAIADDIGCSLAQLAIAWCLKNHHISTVILGASSSKQVVENLEASFIKQQLTDDIMKRIVDVFQRELV